MILLILRVYRKLIIKTFRQHFIVIFFRKSYCTEHSLHNFIKSYCTLSNSYCTLCAPKHTILGPEDQDKDFSSKDKDCIVKDKDCILVLKESLRTRTNITVILHLFVLKSGGIVPLSTKSGGYRYPLYPP